MLTPRETTLPNGLRVLISPSRTPVVSVWTWYRVGARNEVPGVTGISHWVEHLTFKGAGRFGGGEIFRLTSRHGGHNNGFTGEDFTVYYETLPAAHLDLALAIEAARLGEVEFTDADVEAERRVILAEREGAENNAHYLLGERLLALTFAEHPYGRPVIGRREDLERLTAEQLRAHYERYYRPENVLLVIAGGVDADDALRRVEERFGALSRPPGEPEAPPSPEPPVTEARRVALERPGGAAHLQVVYHAPPAGHPDLYPLLALDAVLGGGKPVSWASGGYLGRSARLYRALVETGLATNAGSGYRVSLDPHLFGLSATVREGSDPGAVEAALTQEAEQLAETPPSNEELARAVRQTEAQFAYSRDGATSQGYALGLFATHGEWRDLERHVERLAAVTPEDVQRVAATYLRPERRCTGLLRPGEGNEAGGGPARQPSTFNFQPSTGWFAATGELEPLAPRREVLENGIVLLWRERRESPTVSLRASWPAGAAREVPEAGGLAALTARLLRRGTRRRSAEALSAAADDLGASFSLWAGTEEAAFSAKCLNRDLEAVLAVLREALEEPAFAPEQVEKVRGDALTALRERADNSRYHAERLLAEQLYGPVHPYGRPPAGQEETVAALTRAQVLAFHERHYGPAGFIVAAAGDLDADLLRRHLEGWFPGRAGLPGAHPPPPAPARPAAERRLHPMPHKAQVDLALGGSALPRGHADYHALLQANAVLGTLGMMGRLGAKVREELNLAYYVYSRLHARLWAGEWVASAGVHPDHLEEAVAAVLAEVKRLREELVTGEELADAQAQLVGSLPLRLETSDGVAAYLLNLEYYALGLDYLERYPALVRAVTREQVRAAARRYLDPAHLTLTAAGPVEG